MTDETALIIDHIKAGRQELAELRHVLEAHIKEDRDIAKIVTRHSTYWGFTKWVVLTGVGVVLSFLGVKHVG